MALLQLHGPVPGQVGVEVLPGAAERLPGGLGFLAQAARRGRRSTLAQELLVKGIAIAGDRAAAAWPARSRSRASPARRR